MQYLSNNVRRIFRFISEERKKMIDDYCLLQLGNMYEDVNLNEWSNNERLIKNNDIELLREYSGYNYKHINNALRGIWNYEENGSIESKERFLKNGEDISEIIKNNPTNFGNFKAYRGVNLSYFKEYGISNIEDLKKLTGDFILDKGFVSTSLDENSCFFKKENELNIDYNIKITYLIPEDFDDGIYLQGDMTYSEGQKEYLINNYNLAKVVNVTLNEDNTAYITALMIPKMIYDEYYNSLASGHRK